jgi:hypothetical protein
MMKEKVYGCVNCRVTEQDKKNFPVVNGRIRLKPVSATLFQCVKCGAQHLHPDFKNELADKRIRTEKTRRRIETMREMYRTLKLPIKKKVKI